MEIPAHAAGQCLGWWPGGYACYPCHVTHNPATKRDGPPPRAARQKSAPAKGVNRAKARAECIHLGRELPDQSCGCASKLRKCSEFGTCTTGVKRDGVACCRTCKPPHYVPKESF